MGNTFTVRVTCPACQKRVRLPARALEELGSKLSVVLTCPECGAARPVSVLRGGAPAAPPAPVATAPPPFRPLIAPAPHAAEEAGTAAGAARVPRPTKPGRVTSAPWPAPSPVPEAAGGAPALPGGAEPPPSAASLCAPFAPLETAHGHAMCEPPPEAPSWGDRWRKVKLGRPLLAVGLAVGLLAAGVSVVRTWQRERIAAGAHPVAVAPADGPSVMGPNGSDARREAAGEPGPPARAGRAAAAIDPRDDRDALGSHHRHDLD